MSKKKPIDKAQARERRNRMLDAAAAAQLSLTEGVREMRAIAGMTQEEFAQHRGVSARVIKAIELGQGNPTVATLNRIGQFFGLEVAFVPIQRAQPAMEQAYLADMSTGSHAPQPPADMEIKSSVTLQGETFQNLSETVTAAVLRGIEEQRDLIMRQLAEAIDAMDNRARSLSQASTRKNTSKDKGIAGAPGHKKKKPGAP